MSECRWYVLHAYSGYEKKVADSIIDQAKKLGVAEHIEEVSVPTQNIVEVKRGVRINSERKIFPGYILIKMNLNDDTWHIIKNTPKLSGFLGNKGKPIPISNAEAKRITNNITIAEEISVSLLGGQVTFCNSCLTCLTNKAGEVLFFSIFVLFINLPIFGRSGRT